jgi:hypothetical protein
MTKWQCRCTKSCTNKDTKCTGHQTTIPHAFVFILRPSRSTSFKLEVLPHVRDSNRRWLTLASGNLFILCNFEVSHLASCVKSDLYIDSEWWPPGRFRLGNATLAGCGHVRLVLFVKWSKEISSTTVM